MRVWPTKGLGHVPFPYKPGPQHSPKGNKRIVWIIRSIGCCNQLLLLLLLLVLVLVLLASPYNTCKNKHKHAIAQADPNEVTSKRIAECIQKVLRPHQLGTIPDAPEQRSKAIGTIIREANNRFSYKVRSKGDSQLAHKKSYMLPCQPQRLGRPLAPGMEPTKTHTHACVTPTREQS